MAAHARLKNEFTEDETYHNLMAWLINERSETATIKSRSQHMTSRGIEKQNMKLHIQNESRHDKTNKVPVLPAKTQISLGIRPVWSESSLCA